MTKWPQMVANNYEVITKWSQCCHEWSEMATMWSQTFTQRAQIVTSIETIVDLQPMTTGLFQTAANSQNWITCYSK